jgi:hypothetical protein
MLSTTLGLYFVFWLFTDSFGSRAYGNSWAKVTDYAITHDQETETAGHLLSKCVFAKQMLNYCNLPGEPSRLEVTPKMIAAETRLAAV